MDEITRLRQRVADLEAALAWNNGSGASAEAMAARQVALADIPLRGAPAEAWLRHLCAEMVEHLGVYNAWLALVDNHRVVAVASSFDTSFTPMRDTLLRGECPPCMVRAMSGESMVVLAETVAECPGCPLAKEYEGRLGVCVPIEHEGERYGVITLSAPEQLAADPWLREALSGRAANLGATLHQIRMMRQQQLYQALIGSMYRVAPMGIAVVRGGRMVDVNAMWCRLAGRPRETLLGASVRCLFAEDATYRRVREALREQFRRGEEVSMESGWERPDGSRCAVLIRAAALPSVAGQRGVMVTAVDITERKAMEAALQQSELAAREARRQSDQDRRQLLALMNNLPGLAFRCKNDDAWTMLFVSHGCRALTGYDAEALLGNRDLAYADLIVPEDRAMVAAVVREGLASGTGYTVEYRIRRADGQERVVWERALGQQQPAGGEAVIEGIIVDITERRLLENRLVQMHKLESLGVMAGGLAHDFNNILMAIMGTAELVQEDAAPRSGVAESMQTIITAAQRAADLTRQLLSFCGIGGMRRETVRLNGMVESLMPLLMATAGDAVDVQFQGEADLPPFTADPGEVRQVVMSLFTNAVEALSGSGSIRITTGSGFFSGAEQRPESWSEEPLQGWLVWVSVTDTGAGMTRETMARMFDPFFSTKATGRGMGLAAVMGILKALGGSVRVRSAPGRGTTIKAYFPIHDGAREDAATGRAGPVSESARERRNLVLIADDEAALLALSEHMVRQLGYDVITAKDGEAAVAQFERNRERLHTILLDLTMPRMDGVEAAERMLAVAPEARIVLCTGYSAENLAERLDPGRVAGVLLKPFTREQLSAVLGHRNAEAAR